MPGFSYVAVDKKGKEKRGSVKAENRDKAAESLKEQGLLPVSLKEQGTMMRELELSSFTRKKKIKPRDLSTFCRQFVSIMQAGVPMKEALLMLAQQTENKVLQEAVTNTLTEVEKGNTLAESMAAQGEVFPQMLVSMVEAGEASGNLEMSFSRMAVHFEKEAKLKATIKKATIYPIILIIAAIGVIAVMLLFVIPIFIDMFADLDVEMPALTMGIMNLSKWMTANWYILLALGAAAVIGFRMYYGTPGGRLRIDRLKMSIPLFGKLSVKTACAQFARTTCTLLAAGISMTDCLETSAKILSNIHYSNALRDAKEEVMKGVPLSEPLELSGIFPPMVYHMAGIGEETGTVEDMLEKLADYYDEEVEITTQSILAAMEPLIIVFMALVIGTLVIAVISPIGAMYEGLDHL
ncbi:MAG: type II secretion system F family protein [Eubacteriales bacterium]|nr:type II secretion system F family protein [Eubacteriales bacterium]